MTGETIEKLQTTIRESGRTLDDLAFQVSQVDHVLKAAADRIAEHTGGDPDANERASALVAATSMMLRAVHVGMEALTTRLLNASEG